MKTGTTAIQSYLNINFDDLIKEGILYPKVNQKSMNYLGFSLMDAVPPYVHHTLPVSKDKLYAELKEEIERTKCEKIIISTEAFSLLTTKYFLGEEAPKQVKKLLASSKFNFKIIANVRRQDEYLVSQYNQHVKTHNFWNLYSGNIREFYEDKKELFDFDLILERWEREFGKENIIVGVYNKSTDSVMEFMSLFDVKHLPKHVYEKGINVGMTPKSLEFMRIANKHGIIKNTANQNYTLVNLIEGILGSKDFEYPLDSSLGTLILNDFANGNYRLSQKYLRGNIEWYSPKKAVGLKNDLPELTTEESIKVAAHIWNYFQNKKTE